jgi:hypothetical protein
MCAQGFIALRGGARELGDRHRLRMARLANEDEPVQIEPLFAANSRAIKEKYGWLELASAGKSVEDACIPRIFSARSL